MFYYCKNKSRELEVCRWEYFRIHIIASASQQIPGLSRTFNLNFQDFPGSKSFSRTFQAWKFFKEKFQDFPEGMRTLYLSLQTSITHLSNKSPFLIEDSCLFFTGDRGVQRYYMQAANKHTHCRQHSEQTVFCYCSNITENNNKDGVQFSVALNRS